MLPSETYSCTPASLGSEQLKLISCATVAWEDNNSAVDGSNITRALEL